MPKPPYIIKGFADRFFNSIQIAEIIITNRGPVYSKWRTWRDLGIKPDTRDVYYVEMVSRSMQGENA